MAEPPASRLSRDLFGSFFLGGFECSTHRTTEGVRLDVIAATQHDRLALEDYQLCLDNGIRGVREAARWPFIELNGRFELDQVRALARLGRETGMTQIWDMMHYGYPDGLDPFAPEFVDRFAAYARAVATVIREETQGQTWYTPINEISYFSFAGGEIGYMAPFGIHRGGELKRNLVRAAIAGANAIWEVDPDARIVSVEPLVRVHPPPGRPDLQAQADDFNHRVVYEAFDLLCGRTEPELGGSRKHLGVVGLNYYSGNQWTIATPDQPQHFLNPHDPLWIALPVLLREIEDRYGGPLLIAETGASGDGRPEWLRHLAREAGQSLSEGVDVAGICLYPVVTSPDWEDPTAFFDGGLFDLAPDENGTLERVLSVPVAEALREAQSKLDPENMPKTPLPAEPPQPPPPDLKVLNPVEQSKTKADNFSYTTLAAGDYLEVEVYGVRPGAGVAPHRHGHTEHVLTAMAGEATVHVAGKRLVLKPGESLLIPAGQYYGIGNDGLEALYVQQVSGPKPWDARFEAPHPSTITPAKQAEKKG